MSREGPRAKATPWTKAALVLAMGAPASLAGGVAHRVPADFATIQAAVDAASTGDTVLVADGIYTGAGNRDVDMQGKELVIRSANGPAHCIIDCDGSYEDPHRAFLFSRGESRAARIEGFTIRDGATEPGAIADQFNGGAIRIVGSSPTISDCVFTENNCGCWGGAVYAGGLCSPLIENSLFLGNSADDDGGGLFTWNGASPVVRNSVFIGNSAPAQGGAVCNFGGSQQLLSLINVTIVDNAASSGSGLTAWGPTVVESSIIWGNAGGAQVSGGGEVTISYSDVQGGFPGIGNINSPPAFEKDGFHLSADSPCIDAGSPTPPASPFDIDFQPRLVGPRVDMGADELLGLASRR